MRARPIPVAAIKPVFRHGIRRRRAPAPGDGLEEWERPYRIALADAREVVGVPGRGVAEIARALGEGARGARFCQQGSHLHLEAGLARLAVRLPEGR